MNQTKQELKPTKTVEQIVKTYKKANKDYKAKLLKFYGVKDINRLFDIKTPKTSEVKCNMTELASVLKNHPATQIKVSFNKILSATNLLEQIMDVYEYSPPNKVRESFKKCINKAIKGEETTRNGFHNGKLDGFGRLYFVDTDQILDKSKLFDNRMIIISLNHLNFVEVNNTKYILK